jgi:hypothetical protein
MGHLHLTPRPYNNNAFSTFPAGLIWARHFCARRDEVSTRCLIRPYQRQESHRTGLLCSDSDVIEMRVFVSQAIF